jgi:hypothetical protein
MLWQGFKFFPTGRHRQLSSIVTTKPRENTRSLTQHSGEDNRSVQNSHPKTNSYKKQPEKTTIPHGIIALNAIPLHHNTMKYDHSTHTNSQSEYHSFNTTRRRQFPTEFLPE